MVIRANFAAFLLSLPLSLLVVSQTPPLEVKKPAVRVNYLNVCAPVDAEQKEIAAILARIPAKANFAADFEVARGRSTMQDAPPANWVRVRREFSTVSPLLNVQYSGPQRGHADLDGGQRERRHTRNRGQHGHTGESDQD